MRHHYIDILSRIPEEPAWFDENGVPRYQPFQPSAVANIYAREVALLRICCQSCRRPFTVALSRSAYDPLPLADEISQRSITYGDPPNLDCCPAGPTMTSDTERVLEFWQFNVQSQLLWVRKPNAEIVLDETSDC